MRLSGWGGGILHEIFYDDLGIPRQKPAIVGGAIDAQEAVDVIWDGIKNTTNPSANSDLPVVSLGKAIADVILTMPTEEDGLDGWYLKYHVQYHDGFTRNISDFSGSRPSFEIIMNGLVNKTLCDPDTRVAFDFIDELKRNKDLCLKQFSLRDLLWFVKREPYITKSLEPYNPWRTLDIKPTYGEVYEFMQDLLQPKYPDHADQDPYMTMANKEISSYYSQLFVERIVPGFTSDVEAFKKINGYPVWEYTYGDDKSNKSNKPVADYFARNLVEQAIIVGNSDTFMYRGDDSKVVSEAKNIAKEILKWAARQQIAAGKILFDDSPSKHFMKQYGIGTIEKFVILEADAAPDVDDLWRAYKVLREYHPDGFLYGYPQRLYYNFKDRIINSGREELSGDTNGYIYDRFGDLLSDLQNYYLPERDQRWKPFLSGCRGVEIETEEYDDGSEGIFYKTDEGYGLRENYLDQATLKLLKTYCPLAGNLNEYALPNSQRRNRVGLLAATHNMLEELRAWKKGGDASVFTADLKDAFPRGYGYSVFVTRQGDGRFLLQMGDDIDLKNCPNAPIQNFIAYTAGMRKMAEQFADLTK
ncbi:MAG: hypothetical protein LBM73_03375 [Candidatus Nomurabacteria bacterium]|jgi:hypothetical protein|nr:hypothetical protein [Candidatus Nomurabacteria bacterium]